MICHSVVVATWWKFQIGTSGPLLSLIFSLLSSFSPLWPCVSIKTHTGGLCVAVPMSVYTKAANEIAYWLGTTFDLELTRMFLVVCTTFAIPLLYCQCHVTYGFSCIALLPFPNPPSWLCGIVTYQKDVHFRIEFLNKKKIKDFLPTI